MIYTFQDTITELRKTPKYYRCEDCQTIYKANPVTCNHCNGEIEQAPQRIIDTLKDGDYE